MESFTKWVMCQQTRWRESADVTQEPGAFRKRPYAHIFPGDSWEDGLWPGIRSGAEHPLPQYIKQHDIQRHTYANHLNSSWTLCANLYFPFRASQDGRALLASFLQSKVDERIHGVDAIELEYAEPDDSGLAPKDLLGETGGGRGQGQTSPDLGVIVNEGTGLVLIEIKFTEGDFGSCTLRKHRSDTGTCEIGIAKGHRSDCKSTLGRRYWEHLEAAADSNALAGLRTCPAFRAGYQLLRQQALAEGIAKSGNYDLVVSVVAVHKDNPYLDESLQRNRINGVRGWGDLFPNGKAGFAVFTHQEWVAWVREHGGAKWADWLDYVTARYDL